MKPLSLRFPRIPPAVARKLGFYFYLYVSPLDESVFYVGKGKSGRALAHLRAHEKKEITKVIKEIRAAGEEPRIEILAHGLRSAETAHRVEAAAIDLLGLVPEDKQVVISTNQGVPVALNGKSISGQAFRNISGRILGQDVPLMSLESRGVFGRLSRIVRG